MDEVRRIPGDEYGLSAGNLGPFTAEEARKQPPHAHRNWEIMLILEGEGYLESGEQKLPFSPGIIFCIPPGVPHRNLTDTFYNDYCITVSQYMLPGDRITIYQDDEAHTFLHLIQIYDRVYHQKGLNWLNILRGIETTLQHLLISWEAPHLGLELTTLVQIIQDNCSDPNFRVSAAINALHMSPDYVRRQFRKVYNCSPVTYLNQLRVDIARKLLLTEDLSVSELSDKCGFSDAKYFTRLFHRTTGYSPKQYRTIYRERLLERAHQSE